MVKQLVKVFIKEQVKAILKVSILEAIVTEHLL
jgi:hypothetical protein